MRSSGLTVRGCQGRYPRIHPSCYIEPSAILIGEIEIGEDTSVWHNAVMRADINKITVGKRCNVQDGCLVHASKNYETRVGDQVLLGHGAVVHGCDISDNVLLGIRAVVLDGAKIGPWSIIGAGSVVTENSSFPERSLAVGIPAKVVKTLEERHLKRIEMGVREYMKLAQSYKSMDHDQTRGKNDSISTTD